MLISFKAQALAFCLMAAGVAGGSSMGGDALRVDPAEVYGRAACFTCKDGNHCAICASPHPCRPSATEPNECDEIRQLQADTYCDAGEDTLECNTTIGGKCVQMYLGFGLPCPPMCPTPGVFCGNPRNCAGSGMCPPK